MRPYVFQRVRERSIVLLYHRIAQPELDPWSLCVSPQHFAEHLTVLRSLRCVRLREIRPSRWRFPPGLPPLALTFDDGYADNLFAGLPILERFECPATFFIVARDPKISGDFWWDELANIVFSHPMPDRITLAGVGEWRAEAFSDRYQWHQALYASLQPLLPDQLEAAVAGLRVQYGMVPSRRETHRTMTEEELSVAAAHPLIEIGAHTMRHPRLSSLSAAEQCHEIHAGRQRLQDITGLPITSFAYPFGGPQHFNAESVTSVMQAGFERACTTEAASVEAWHLPYRIPRLHVPDLDGDRFARMLRSYL